MWYLNMQWLHVGFAHHLIGNVAVAVEVEAGRFVVQVAACAAAVEKHQGPQGVYAQPLGEVDGNCSDAVAEYYLLYHGSLGGVVILSRCCHILGICRLMPDLTSTSGCLADVLRVAQGRCSNPSVRECTGSRYQ